MTATTARRPARRAGGHAFRALLAVEVRLLLRDPGATFFALAFPTVLLLGIGLAFPGMRETISDAPPPWSGLQVIHLFTPAVLAAAIATPALTTMPVFVAGYREQGVLRRLSTTPVRPRWVLVAQVVVNVVAVLVASLIALALGAALFDSPAPVSLVLAVVAFVLTAAAMLGVGLLIAALAPRASVATGSGMLLYFPMLFFAGLWTPGPLMPDGVRQVASFTPLGAGSQALMAAWFAGDVPARQLVVLAAYVLVLYPVSARVFRWQ